MSKSHNAERRGGRIPDAGVRRSVQIYVRVTPDEHDQVRQKAASRRRTISRYVRELVFDDVGIDAG